MQSEDQGTQLTFRLLGPLEVEAGGRPLALGGPRQRALLAQLLLSANEVVRRERLMDGLWGDEPPSTAANALQVAVHGLRKALGSGRIARQGPGYVLRAEPGEVDRERFETLVAQARGEQPAEAVRLLSEALSLWRGPALADVADAPFAGPAIAQLEERRLLAAEERIEAELALGRHAQLVAELDALIAEHPLRERLRRQKMLALYRSGRQAEALEAYAEARRVLVGELGIEPSKELHELESAILRQDPALTGSAQAALTGVQANLPAPPTALIGRRLEVAAVTGLLRRADVRLVTLTGPGGTGKTRLALQAAAELAAEHADGVVFVDLAPLEDDALVASTIAHALGAAEGEVATVERLKQELRPKALLLVLDNFERVDAAAPVVSELLAGAPDLKVLVTSRAVLRLSGEHEYLVPPLRTPDPARARDVEELARNEAVALFVARARAVQHGFTLSRENRGAVAEVCVALEGLPLAIELAAARVGSLSPPALLDRLEQRLELLTGGPRDAPERHQTLRATIDWSHGLLDPAERELFAGLAVFAGGCTLAAVETIFEAPLETLEGLVAKSLLQREQGVPGEVRFRMLETVREYALERLAASVEADDARRRHALYFAGLAEQGAEVLWGPVQGPEHEIWLDRLEADHDNLRAALAWGSRHHDETTLRLAAAMFEFWESRGYIREGREWLERALERGSGAAAPLRAKALHAAGYLAYDQGDYERGDEHCEASLALYRELGDKEGEGRTVHVLGWAAEYRGDVIRAATLAEESLSLARQLGHVRGVIVSLGRMALAAAKRGDFAAAEAMLDEALALAREHEDRVGEGGILGTWGELVAQQGDHEAGGRMLAESIVLYREAGHPRAIPSVIHQIAALAELRGVTEQAVQLFGASNQLYETVGASLPPSVQVEYRATLDRARAALGEAAFEAAWEYGRTLPPEQAVELARSVAVSSGSNA